ncbi:LCP family protein [Nocardioides cavernaquae]|uniref:LytR family transcriptional regulator n=1 Tax=Nocardioides cavernaquae TaxID=2321396 RepID=A0A3A5H3M3_9ACTN|nr:LCP family protein [Nocardioides cavernaquae]RJS45363.1 LytR family transcriptional regulator [Nocardioides cavernaquae]
MDERSEEMHVLHEDMHFDTVKRVRRRRRNSLWARKTRRLRHWIKEHKALSVLIGIVLFLLLILLLWLLWLWMHLNEVERFDLDLDDRPPYYGGQNILLVGLDCDAEAPVSDSLRHCNPDEGTDLSDLEHASATGNRSDVIMVLHVSEDGSKAQLVSIPRDSYVEVKGHGRTKINAAFSYGGPSLLAHTVEQATGLYINHMAVVDFHGFKGISNAIGGVQVYVKDEITVPGTGQVAWPQGWQTIKGEDALTYVRTRYGLPRGDFDRVQRHQNFLRAVMQRTQSMAVLANPLAVTRLVGEVTGNLAVDSGFKNSEILDLTFAGLQLRMDDISYATVPYEGSAMVDGASVVLLKEKEMRELFDAIAHDRFISYVNDHPVETLPADQDVD